MNEALEILPADYWRWWLLANAPESSDSDFTWEAFQGGINKDLADVLGNFVSRVTKFCNARFGAEVPAGGEYGAEEARVIAEIKDRLAKYEAAFEAIEFRRAAQELRAIWVIGNEYLQSAEPWAVFKTDPDRAAGIIRFALNLIRLYATLAEPFIPTAARTIHDALGTEPVWPQDLEADLSALSPGHAFTVPDVLFAKITDDAREEMAARFAGS